MMKKDIAIKWINYLRGKRKATGSMGARNGGRCCLGHLGQLYAEETGTKIKWREEGDQRGFYFPELGETSEDHWKESEDPGVYVREWAGLQRYQCTELAADNDTSPGFPIRTICEIAGLDPEEYVDD